MKFKGIALIWLAALLTVAAMPLIRQTIPVGDPTSAAEETAPDTTPDTASDTDPDTVPETVGGDQETAPASVSAETAEVTATTEKAADKPEITKFSFYRSQTGETDTISPEDYVLGVVTAEMPVSFGSEALKAQAVAARTYALCRIGSGKVHADGSPLCDSASCCAAYLSPSDAAERWGADAAGKILSDVKSAVNATAGEIVLYDNRPISAVWHSSSFGTTESAEAVWGYPVPYLIPVPTPEEDKRAEADLPIEKLREIIFSSDDGHPASDSIYVGANRELAVSLTPSGRVSRLTYDGKTVSGSVLRSALGLNSCRMEISLTEDSVKIVTHGYGHGVGMSQYGAAAMASQGASYKEILSHYYPGTEIGSGK